MTTGFLAPGRPDVRSRNEAHVLDLVRAATTGLRGATIGRGGALTAPGGISRVELAERTGLTPQAVSKIVARLREMGLVDEAGRGVSTGGKPPTLLRLVRDARHAVGVHMERDELTVLLADLTGEAVASETVPFDLGGDKEAVLNAVVDRVESVAQGYRDSVIGVGVACPGPLDHRAGVLLRVTHLAQWAGFPLRDVLSERLGLPVVLDKDTNAAVLAVLGADPQGVDPEGANCAYLHLGTGLGAGLVLNGALYRGGRTMAGEFGHQTVQVDGPMCVCGNRGCLEAMSLAALRDGDVAGAAQLMGVGAANLLRLLDIDLVVLGGRQVLAAPDLYLREVAAVLVERVPDLAWQPVPVTVAESGVRAIADGAAQLILAPLFRPGRLVVG